MNIYRNILFVCCIGFVWGNTSCPDVWVADRGSCYLFMPDQSLSFIEAQHYCSQHKAHLAVVNDAEESRFLKTYLGRLLTRSWWIGLTDELVEGSWVWYSTGDSPEYTDWFPGEPDSRQGQSNEDCASMFHDNKRTEYKWVDIGCNHLFSPICEM